VHGGVGTAGRTIRVMPVSDRPRGRPRSSQAHQAILEATRDLLASGYERLSIEAIAARAGVGKQTVYRWWPSKAAVVAEAVLAGYLPTASGPPPDTGDLTTDLRSWIREKAAWLADPGATALVRGLAAAAADSETDAARLYDQLAAPIREELVGRLAAGVDRSRLRRDADLDAAADALMGALLYRALAGTVGTAGIDGLIEVIVAGLENVAAPRPASGGGVGPGGLR
jgi:AcrR family transcriptional regulator